jgi:hypothetical protein
MDIVTLFIDSDIDGWAAISIDTVTFMRRQHYGLVDSDLVTLSTFFVIISVLHLYPFYINL